MKKKNLLSLIALGATAVTGTMLFTGCSELSQEQTDKLMGLVDKSDELIRLIEQQNVLTEKANKKLTVDEAKELLEVAKSRLSIGYDNYCDDISMKTYLDGKVAEEYFSYKNTDGKTITLANNYKLENGGLSNSILNWQLEFGDKDNVYTVMKNDSDEVLSKNNFDMDAEKLFLFTLMCSGGDFEIENVKKVDVNDDSYVLTIYSEDDYDGEGLEGERHEDRNTYTEIEIGLDYKIKHIKLYRYVEISYNYESEEKHLYEYEYNFNKLTQTEKNNLIQKYNLYKNRNFEE